MMSHEVRRRAMTLWALLGIAACSTVDPPGNDWPAGETGLVPLTEEPGVATVPVPLRVNCGGTVFYTQGGIMYSNDSHYLDGDSSQNTAISSIQGTEDDELYKTERVSVEEHGSFGYEFPVGNGNYVARLHLAEIWFGTPAGPPGSSVPGQRVFSVDMEGQRRLSSYDIIADVGSMAATVKDFHVTVSDGSLSLQLTASTNKPTCAAIEVLPAPAPYAGVIQIPGRIEAENFDHGGEGSAYHDGWTYNQGQQYRPGEGVDIEWSSAESGYSVGWTAPGEWLGYTVNVSQRGYYTVHARVASAVDGGTFHVELGGVDKTGPIHIPYTGGWDSWQTVTVRDVWLDAGPQTLRVVMDAAGGSGHVGNINFIELVSLIACATPRLRWAPPPLEDPILLTLGTGPSWKPLLEGRDYIIRFPSQKKIGKTHLVGGRNIHIIGGHATVAPGESEHVILLEGQTGTVHIEGLLLDNSGGREADGIAINAPDATVQLQNLRIVDLIGGQDKQLHNHSDVVQPWGGVKELRIDRLTGSSNFQGLFLVGEYGPVGPVIIQNTNLYYQPAPPNQGGYMLWLPDCSAGSVTLSNFYVTPRSGVRVGKAIWPDDENGSCPALVIDNRATWPDLPQVRGSVTGGAPPNGDFVPAGSAGLGYVSPGYCQ